MSVATLDDFVSYETVLSVLGADRSELPQEVYIARELWEELSTDFSAWLPSGWDLDGIVNGEEDLGEGPSAAEKLIMLRAYARYFCAWLLLQSGDLLFAESISDGQNQVQRSKRVDYIALMDRMRGRMETFKTAILQMEDPSATYSTPTFFSSASPSYDPVMNETV